jgi:pimeloyl-ACP methyl ester carboxylesterase
MAEAVDRADPGWGAGVSIFELLEAIPRFADAVVLPTIWETQRALRNRAYGVAGMAIPGAILARDVHQGFSQGSVGAIRLSLRSCSIALRGMRTGLGPHADPKLHGPRVQAAAAVLNGLAGDHLAVQAPGLAIQMSVRHDGRDVELDAASLAEAFPNATGRIAVFLHGLCDDEGRWSDAAETSCTEAVRDMGWTPTLIRFNSGLSLRENGVGLARLLDDLIDAWPLATSQIALIGHSLGGLIAHTAVDAARTSELPWLSLLTDVITLATPHLGSDLARLAEGGSRVLALLPETTPLARLVDTRSAGIKDLGPGLPQLERSPNVRYRTVSGQLRTPWGPLVGDLLVRQSSATGQTQNPAGFSEADRVHLPSTGHLAVVRHPDLQGKLREWLR